MLKKIIPLLVLLFAVLFMNSCKNGNAAIQQQDAVNVNVQTVESFNTQESIAYSGSIVESESVPLSFMVTGRVEQVLVSEGDYVKKGQLLAELDKETLSNAYEMALATYNQAKDAYARLKPMYENGNLPEIKFIDVETKLQQAKSASAISKKNLDDCALYAPSNGYIGSRSIEPGMTIVPGITAINIVKINKVYASISVPENEIVNISRNQNCQVNVAALGKQIFDGVVEQVGVVANPLSRAYKVKVSIANQNNVLKPGMICDVTLEKSESSSSVVVPNYSVMVDESGKTFVYTVEQNNTIAKRKWVTTGALARNGVEIVDGLTTGETLVVAGHQKLMDGARVVIVN